MEVLDFSKWLNESYGSSPFGGESYYSPGSSGWYRQQKKQDEIYSLLDQVKDSPEKINDLHYRDKANLAHHPELPTNVIQALFLNYDYPATLYNLFKNSSVYNNLDFIKWLDSTGHLYSFFIGYRQPNIKYLLQSENIPTDILFKLYSHYYKTAPRMRLTLISAVIESPSSFNQELVEDIAYDIFNEAIKIKKDSKSSILNLLQESEAFINRSDVNQFLVVSQLARQPFIKLYSTKSLKKYLDSAFDLFIEPFLSNKITLNQEEFNELIRNPNLPNQLKEYLYQNPNYFAPDDILSDWFN